MVFKMGKARNVRNKTTKMWRTGHTNPISQNKVCSQYPEEHGHREF